MYLIGNHILPDEDLAAFHWSLLGPEHPLASLKVMYPIYFVFFLRFYLFSERGGGREKERGRNMDVREKHLACA